MNHVCKFVSLLMLALIASDCVFGEKIPADSSATPATVALFKRMNALQAEGIMIGHQDAYLYGHDWKYDGVPDVKQVTGDYPAVFGWELGDLELGEKESLDGVLFDKIKEGIIWVHAKGGINTVSWHAANVLTGGNSWDVSSEQVVKSILPGGDKEEAFKIMLDRMADFFLSLKTDEGEQVPLIFRPYHEHTGNWFWWGKKLCTRDEYVKLWTYTVSYLRNKGVHNLLYAYSAAGNFKTADQYLERYPGDEYVDIIGFDSYQHGNAGRNRYIAGLKSSLDIVVPISVEKNKIVILAETGIESVPDPEWWTGTLWKTIQSYPISYVLCWRNAYNQPDHYYMPFPSQKSAADFKVLEELPATLFLKDIQD